MATRVLNFGSINIDTVFSVPRIAAAGETLAALSVSTFAGGKGANQSMALARAGASVLHAGRVGGDGLWIVHLLGSNGVDTRHIIIAEKERTGAAMIQVSQHGDNAIVLNGGANQLINEAQIRQTLDLLSAGDWLLLQNEISNVAIVISEGKRRGLYIAFNPAPATPDLRALLPAVDLLIVNQGEAEMLTGASEPEAALAKLPCRERIITLGARGAIYAGPNGQCAAEAPKVNALDTTAAGDTFIGYFLAGRMRNETCSIACDSHALPPRFASRAPARSTQSRLFGCAGVGSLNHAKPRRALRLSLYTNRYSVLKLFRVMRIRTIVSILALFCCTLAARGGTITVAAAISMKEALVQAATDYEKTTHESVEFAFGSSGQLSTQIQGGAPIDLFISAAQKQVDDVVKAGMADDSTRRVIAGNRLVLIVPHDAKHPPTTLSALTGDDIKRIAIGQPNTVPAGQYAQQAIAHAGLAQALSEKLVLGTNVRQVLDYVERGEVSAGIVYVTDAKQAGAKVQIALQIDPSTHDAIEYPAIVINTSKNVELAARFRDYLLSAAGQETLKSYGFTPAAPAPAATK